MNSILLNRLLISRGQLSKNFVYAAHSYFNFSIPSRRASAKIENFPLIAVPSALFPICNLHKTQHTLAFSIIRDPGNGRIER